LLETEELVGDEILDVLQHAEAAAKVEAEAKVTAKAEAAATKTDERSLR